MRSAFLLVPGLLALAACQVPGRNITDPAPQTPSVVTLDDTEAQTGRVPLVTIETPVSAAGYVSPLAGAVRAAQSRKPDVTFDVLAAVPDQGTPDRQTDAAKALTPDLIAIAESIAADGISPDRIRLGAMVAPAKTLSAIRVYVR
jgi:hypothetical protein